MSQTRRFSVKISENIFRRNSQYAVKVESSSEMILEMTQNQFINNTGTTIVNLNAQGATNVMNIFKNIWKHNFGHAMIRLNMPEYSKTSHFFDNELTQNVISEKYPLLTEYFVFKLVGCKRSKYHFFKNL